MKITLKDRWYYDENNNRWDADYETEESAIKKSESLTGCSDCSDCSYCSRCSYCSGCYDCSRCSYCSGCYDCSGYKENPQRYVTPQIGSKNAQTTMYWLDENIQVIYGCFKGDLKQFEDRIKEVHANTIHLQPYLQQIEIMKYLINPPKGIK